MSFYLSYMFINKGVPQKLSHLKLMPIRPESAYKLNAELN
jgi:hypothetical protein